MTRSTQATRLTSTRNCLLLLSILASLALSASCQQDPWGSYSSAANRRQRSALAARRAADDSRPLTRVPSQYHARTVQSRADTVEPTIITGRFKAPAPEQIQQARMPKSSQFGSHTMSASYRVADAETPEKLVHGIAGATSPQTGRSNQSIQRTVSAKFQVSDEGLNYPPSKLSADIYGNVAEIVTAPPEAVENDFLLPNSRRFGNQVSRP